MGRLLREVSSKLRSEWQLWEALGRITAGGRELLQKAQARHRFRGVELVKVTDMAESEWAKEVEILCQTCKARIMSPMSLEISSQKERGW